LNSHPQNEFAAPARRRLTVVEFVGGRFVGGLLVMLFVHCCPMLGAQSGNGGSSGSLSQPQVNTDARSPDYRGPGMHPDTAEIVTKVHVVLDDGGPPVGKLELDKSSCASAWINSRGVATLISPRSSDGCGAYVSSVGFRTLRLETSAARSRYTAVMRRIGNGERGSASEPNSVTALRIPPPAHKAYAEGEMAMGLGRWTDAVDWFNKALADYPAYALAWDELGTAFNELRRTEDAKKAFQKALAADPSLARPCIHLAGMALNEERYDEAAGYADCAVHSPQGASLLAWYYDAVANLRLRRFARAESSARQAIRMDGQHVMPNVEYILGAALDGQRDVNGAIEPGARR